MVIAVIGALYVIYTFKRFENERNDKVLQIARSIVAALPKEDIKELEAKPGDINKPQYHVVKNALKAIIRVNTKARFAYIYTEKNGKIFFIADSEPEDSKDYSPPGQEYPEAKLEDIQPFRDKMELITNSLTDRWGTWRSVFIPIEDEATGKIMAVFGMDYYAKKWDIFVVYQVLESGILITFLILTFLFLYKIKVNNNILRFDLSKRIKAEQALKESELRYQTLARNSPVGIFRTDAKGNTTYVNPKWCQISGLSASEAMGDGWLRAVHPDDLEKLKENWVASTRTSSVSSAEYRFVLPDGSVAWVIGRAVLEDKVNEEVTGYVGTITDITERRLAEIELRENNSRLELAMQVADMAWWEMNIITGDVIFGKRKAEMLDYPPEKFKHYRDFMALVHPDDYNKAMDAMRKHLEGVLDKYEVEYRILAKSGEYLWFYDIGSVVKKDSSGKPIKVTGLVINITGRKLTEMILKESEEKFRNLVETTNDIIWETNAEGLYTYVSPQIEDILGYKPESLIGCSPFDFIPDVEVEAIRKKSDEIVASKKVFSGFISNNLTKDGHLEILETSGVPILDQQNNLLGYRGINHDITQRKRAEEALRESERSKSTLLSNLPGVAYRCRFDRHWTMEFLSEGCLSLTGYEKEAIIGNRDISYNKLILPEYREYLWNVWQKAVQCHGAVCEEYRILTADNREKWVWEQGNPVFNSAGEVEALEGLIIDITDRKLMEQALLKGKQQYENLVSRIPVGIYILHSTPDGAFALEYVSPRMAEMLNLNVEKLLAETQTVFQAIHPDDREGFISLNLEGIQLKKPFDWKGRFLVDGMVRWLHFVSSPELLENGDILWHGLVVDITEQKKAQQEINQMNAELEQRVKQRTLQLENSNRELEAFSYSVSHDLRAPLRGIDGWSLALLEDYNHLLDDKGHLYLARVRNESQRMGILIDDLLKLSQVNRIDMNKVKLNISEIAQTITLRLREYNSSRICEFIIEPGLDAWGDPQMLEIALTNLLDNAYKFTGSKELAKIEFGVQQMNDIPTYYVRDNGVGFNMVYAKKLFGAFQRMHSHADFPGSGIGLATVQRIITRHGGRIWAESKQGEGTTFFFTLSFEAEA